MYQVALNLRLDRREGAEDKVGLAEQSPPAAQRGSSLPVPTTETPASGLNPQPPTKLLRVLGWAGLGCKALGTPGPPGT